MNATEFKSSLKESFKSSGLADKLKSQLRAKLVAELVLRTRQAGDMSFGLVRQDGQEDSIYTKVIDSLIVGYLKAMSYDFTISVFLPESGQQKQLLSDGTLSFLNSSAELSALLHLSRSCALTSQLRAFEESEQGSSLKRPLLEKIVKAVSLYTNTPMNARETQTSEADDVLEWSIRRSDKEADIRNEYSMKQSAMALEDRMMRYQRDVDARMNSELEARVWAIFVSYYCNSFRGLRNWNWLRFAWKRNSGTIMKFQE